MTLLDEISVYNPTEREIPAFPRQLLAYLPPIIRDVDEMVQIMQAEQPEVFELWEAAQKVLNEQFIGTMSEYGVHRWETILRLKPGAGDNLDERKERILMALRVQLPYTLRWLQQWLLDSFGEGNFRLDIDRYTIEIELYHSRWPEDHPIHKIYVDVLELLSWVRPANMLMKIINSYEYRNHLYACTGAGILSEIELPPVSRDRTFQRTQFFISAAYETAEITLRPAN